MLIEHELNWSQSFELVIFHSPNVIKCFYKGGINYLISNFNHSKILIICITFLLMTKNKAVKTYVCDSLISVHKSHGD